MTTTEIRSHVQLGIDRYYKPDSAAVAKICRLSCVFIRFSVTKNSKIKNLSFSGDTVAIIRKGLSEAVMLLENDIDLMKDLARSGKTIIQPFIYEYQQGCGLGRNSNNMNEAPLIKPKDPLHEKSEAEILLEAEYYKKALLEMLTFDGEPLAGLDCLILTPMMVGSGSMF